MSRQYMITVRDWGDDPTIKFNPETGNHSVVGYCSRVPSIGYHIDHLEIDGFDETIWVSHQYSIDIEEI